MGTSYRIAPELVPPAPIILRKGQDGGTSADLPPAVMRAIPTVGTSTEQATAPDWGYVAGGFGGLIAVWLIAAFLIHDPGYGRAADQVRVVPGFTILAVFFVAAQGLERLLEPLAMILNPGPAKELQGARAAVEQAMQDALAEQHDSAREAREPDPSKNADLQARLDRAAEMSAKAEVWKLNRRVLFWAVASAVAVLASSSMKLYFLHAIGMASPPRPLEILATGLIIGGGTKPLHDLVTLISAKADTVKSVAGTTA